MKNLLLLLFVLGCSVSGSVFAQPGALDAGFGTGGKAIFNLGYGDDYARALAIQPNGQIIVVGSAFIGPKQGFGIMRCNTFGIMDYTFGLNGKVATSLLEGNMAEANAVVVQPDGKIVAAGFTESEGRHAFALIRYTSKGGLDNGFGSGGKVITGFGNYAEGNALALQPDGKLVVAGYIYDDGASKFALARYLSDGSLDNTFGSNGLVTTGKGNSSRFNALALQSDGKIVAVGYVEEGFGGLSEFAVIRYNPDGTPDNDFGQRGKVFTDVTTGAAATAVAIQPNGKIVVVGFTYISAQIAVARYLQNGTLDNSFGPNGTGILTTSPGTGDSEGNAVAIEPDGEIVVVGSSMNEGNLNYAVIRCNPDGMPDQTFGVNGTMITEVGPYFAKASSVAIDPDEKIVVAGTTYRPGFTQTADFALVRYLTGLDMGILDFSASVQSAVIYPDPIIENATLKYILDNPEVITIKLVDMQGKTIKTFVENDRKEAGEYCQNLVLPNKLALGYYYIIISSETGRVSIKIVK